MIRTEPADPKPKGRRGIQDMALGRVDIFRMDPRELRIEEGWNQRIKTFDPADEEDRALAASIAEVGVKTPLTVYMRDGAPVVTDGHRRLGAVLYALDTLKAEIRSVPVQTEPKHASEADRFLSQIVRNSGKPFAAIEKANVFAKLMDLGWDEGTIATKVGLTRQRVSDLLKLRAGPQAVVDMVTAGEISAGLALGEIKAAAMAQGKTRATAKHVERGAAPDLTKHPAYAAGLRAGLSRAAEIVRSGGGAAEIEAATMAALPQSAPTCAEATCQPHA